MGQTYANSITPRRTHGPIGQRLPLFSAAYARYLETEPQRDAKWEEVYTSADPSAAIYAADAADGAAIQELREALYADTSAYNRREDCMLLNKRQVLSIAQDGAA